ncbi:MAG: MerR family transcriptional regulator, partial [Oligoflexia bacterium]|nr:MerR family transcriptional regulator [Oligoflexia bacterium]
MLKINEFSKKTGFSSRMLRHLEELDLLRPNRNDKNYRIYSEEHIPTAIKIKSFQKLGFSLKEIKTILSMSIEQLEKNLAQLFRTKQKENIHIETQLKKIRLLENAIKNKNCNFDFIEQLDEITAEDRSKILLGNQELTDRVVRGKMPRIESVNKAMFELIKSNDEKYKNDSVDLYKFGEYFKITPKTYYIIFEVEEFVCYFFAAIAEDELIKNKDQLEIENIDIYDTRCVDSITCFVKNIMSSYTKAFRTIYI